MKTTYDNSNDFVNDLNKLRKDNKNNWYFWVGEVIGKNVQIKGYNTWLQICKINNIDHSNVMDQKVTQFIQHITKAIEYNHPV